jgi:hypothetical protein
VGWARELVALKVVRVEAGRLENSSIKKIFFFMKLLLLKSIFIEYAL